MSRRPSDPGRLEEGAVGRTANGSVCFRISTFVSPLTALDQPSLHSLGYFAFSMTWHRIHRHRGHQPTVQFLPNPARRTPYLPQSSVNPHFRQRTFQPGARICGFNASAPLLGLSHYTIEKSRNQIRSSMPLENKMRCSQSPPSCASASS